MNLFRVPKILEDRIDHFLEVIVQHRDRFLRTQLFGKVCESTDVGEERGDFLALAVEFGGSPGVDDLIEDVLGNVARERALEILPLLQTDGHLVERVGDFPKFVLRRQFERLAVVACRDTFDGVADGNQRSGNPSRCEAGQEIGGNEGNAESQRSVPKQARAVAGWLPSR